MHPFEKTLELASNDIDFTLCGHAPLAWSDFWLNPRRLRGSDFLMRWSQGLWSEERLTQAVNDTADYFAIPYGPSSVAPEEVRAFELYFERLEAAGLGKLKRPDLLVFRKAEREQIERIISEIGDVTELPFTSDENVGMRELLSYAIIAVECENSLWRAKKMPDYNAALTAQKRLNGQMGLKKNAVLPTVIIKEEDFPSLLGWQAAHGVPIHIWHAFYDLAFGLSLDEAQNLVASGLIEPTVQTFQAPGGATSKKAIYKFYYHYAYPLGETLGEIELLPDHIEDKNGHILPYVRFKGGTIELQEEAIQTLDYQSEKWNTERASE